jgi:hypothetical protein
MCLAAARCVYIVMVPVSVLVLMSVGVFVGMSLFVKMLVRIMKVDMSFPDHLANEIVRPEE